ncbi:MAG: winged helix DNA-binding domain-containing protein [Gammaproteobacteria bacterium]|nr:winged helix DNA-binding domain-containing protein [Gammaproteobacteria bacterium]
MTKPETPVLSVRQVRRLALAKAGLLRPELTDLPTSARGVGQRTRDRALQIVERFGYLQLDTVAIAGARTQSIVLASRLDGFQAPMAETLLAPGEPLFEYWGHEACWLPMSLYPSFQFRREEFAVHPWHGDVLGQHRKLADELLARLAADGPIRSLDLEGERLGSGSGWGTGKLAKRVLNALWTAGHVAIRERPSFQRVYDLTEHVIPASIRAVKVARADAFERLLATALAGHGWAATGTLAATWRLRNCRSDIDDALHRLEEGGELLRCDVAVSGRRQAGWISPDDLELAFATDALRPRKNRGVLLSPFDPLLWDRKRVEWMFGFEQVLEIYKPVHERRFGYYCLPVLAGENLIARVDLKANRDAGSLQVLSLHYEQTPSAADREAVRSALERFQVSVGLAQLHGLN